MSEYREHIPCNPEIPCKLRETIGCFEDIHHEAYPRRQYRTELEKKFRENILNKVLICRQLHNDHHATTKPPKKPTINEMREFVYDQ